MITKQQLMATLIGFVVLFLLGWLFYGFLLMDFYAENTGSASNVMRADEEVVWWALIVGNLFQTYFIVLIFDRWASISTFSGGLKAGAIIGLLWGIAINFSMYGTTNLMNLTSALVDPIVSTITIAIAGGVIGAMLGRS